MARTKYSNILKLLTFSMVCAAPAALAGNSSGGGSPPPPTAFTYYVPSAPDADPAEVAGLKPVREIAAQLLMEGVIAEIRVGHREGGHVSNPTREPAVCLHFNSYAGYQIAYERLGNLPEGVETTASFDCRGVPSPVTELGGEPQQDARQGPSVDELVIAAFKADPAVQARLGELTGNEEFAALLLSQGGELPDGTMTPIFFDKYLVVARIPAFTPHGFYQTNVFAQVFVASGVVTSIRLVDFAASRDG